MTRTWHIDHLDGWRTDIAEQPDGSNLVVTDIVEQLDASLVVTVTSDTGRVWRALRTDIEEAIALAWHNTTEQRLIGCLIDPELPA